MYNSTDFLCQALGTLRESRLNLVIIVQAKHLQVAVGFIPAMSHVKVI